MKELKTLYKIIYDDLKDSDMLIGYAKELKKTNKSLADMYMTDAKNRLAHSQIMHKEFTSLIDKMIGENKSSEMADCLWEEISNHYMEWYESLENCIKKW